MGAALSRQPQPQATFKLTPPAAATSTISHSDNTNCNAAGVKRQRTRAMCVFVRNLAGTVLVCDVHADSTVGELKRLVHVAAPRLVECSLERQRLFLMPSSMSATWSSCNTFSTCLSAPASVTTAVQDAFASSAGDCASPETLDDDARTLRSYGIEHETTVHVVVRAQEMGVCVRALGSHGSGAGQLRYPFGMCISPDGELLYVVDQNNLRVQVFRASDGAHVRSFESRFATPSFVCLSPDGELLFVTDSHNHRVQVLRAHDGSHVRSIGSRGSNDSEFNCPRGVCLSPDGERLFVAEQGNHRVQVVRASDGAHIFTIAGANSHGNSHRELVSEPKGLCLSPDGELLFVADRARVHVFQAADGVLLCSLGSQGSGGYHFNHPWGICISPDGQLLYVADRGNHRVQVVRVSDGVHVRTIGAHKSMRRNAFENVGQLYAPVGVCLSPNGDFLFCTETDAYSRVQVFTACE